MLAQLEQHIRAECMGNLYELVKQKITLPKAVL